MLLDKNYILIKIGSGMYSTVWMVYEYIQKKFKLKIENQIFENGIDEIKLLKKYIKMQNKIY